MNLAAIDVNLLVVFDALVNERSVTRAATRVGLSQPAVSNALNRLRTLVGDPLLIRSAREMIPTPRALELAGPIHRALSEIQRALDAASTFDPKSAERTVRLAVTDYVAVVLLPRLLHRLARLAPRIDVETQPLNGNLPSDDLRSGRVDLAFGNFPQPVSSPLRQQALFNEEFVCVMRRDHPRAGRRLTLAQFVKLSHVLVSPRGERTGIVDRKLAERGLARRVALTTAHFMVAPTVVSRTDLITTLPRRGAEALGEALRLRLIAPPLRLPRFTISIVWHGRTDEDPQGRWLREQVRNLCREL